MEYNPRVSAALAAVPEDVYTLNADGSLVTQTTARERIAATLDGLDLQPGMKVLEIGTGSGYSSALLSELIGPSGTVVTVDIVPELIERARRLHVQGGRNNVVLLAADGHEGAPEGAPFDRVVAWTTPEVIPHTWVEQTRPGGLIVAPVELAGLVKTHAVVTAKVGEGHGLKGLALTQGGYVEMHGADLGQWTVPPRGVDAHAQDDQGATWWIAGAWAKEHPADAESLLARFADGVRTVRVFEDGDDPAAFRAWLYATHPSELVVLGGPQGFGIGVADAAGAFLFRPVGLDALTIGTPAESTARGWVQEWRTAGCPGWAQVRPVLRREGSGWQVRPVLRREGSGWQVRAERSEPAHS